METQTLKLETVVGPQDIPAPAGWEFDKTAVIVWAALLQVFREIPKGYISQIDKRRFDAKIDLLSIILANSLGMASPYWRNAAQDLCR